MTFTNTLIVNVIIQLSGYTWSAFNKSEKYYDTMGAVSYIVCTLFSIISNDHTTKRSLLASLMLLVWSTRLGWFLCTRMLYHSDRTYQDKRFNGVRDKPLHLLFYWCMQITWITITLLPIIFINQKESSTIAASSNLSVFDYLFFILWAIGFLMEAISDYQKREFNKKNKGKFISSGLWYYCRHPNYVGEIIVHWGIYLFALPSLNWSQSMIALVSPLFITFLMTRIATPMLEEITNKHYENDKNYQNYLRTTPKLYFNFFK